VFFYRLSTLWPLITIVKIFTVCACNRKKRKKNSKKLSTLKLLVYKALCY
jgi:hypothetical protein